MGIIWIVAEYPDTNYKNPYVANSLGTKPIAAFFRYDLAISPDHAENAPVIDSGVSGNANPDIQLERYTVAAHDPDAATRLHIRGRLRIKAPESPILSTTGFPVTERGFWTSLGEHYRRACR